MKLLLAATLDEGCSLPLPLLDLKDRASSASASKCDSVLDAVAGPVHAGVGTGREYGPPALRGRGGSGGTRGGEDGERGIAGCRLGLVPGLLMAP